MPGATLTPTDFADLSRRVTAHDGPGIVVWCLEHGGFREAEDLYALRWVSPDGTVDIVVGPEQGADHQVQALGAAIFASLHSRFCRCNEPNHHLGNSLVDAQ